MSTQRRVRSTTAAIALLLTGAMMTGCTAVDSDADHDAAWVEPGWMAQLRQDKEEHQLEMLACFGEQGVQATALAAGDVVVTHESPSPAGVLELIDEAMMACHEQVGGLSWFSLAIDDAAYQRMLDSRACLIAHGNMVPEPPSLDVWTQDGGLWNPHGQVYDNRLAETGESWTQTEWAQLNTACPQPGPAVFDVSGLPQ